MLKTAAVAPIPIVNDRIAVIVKVGFLSRVRMEWRTSSGRVFMQQSQILPPLSSSRDACIGRNVVECCESQMHAVSGGQ